MIAWPQPGTQGWTQTTDTSYLALHGGGCLKQNSNNTSTKPLLKFKYSMHTKVLKYTHQFTNSTHCEISPQMKQIKQRDQPQNPLCTLEGNYFPVFLWPLISFSCFWSSYQWNHVFTLLCLASFTHMTVRVFHFAVNGSIVCILTTVSYSIR